MKTLRLIKVVLFCALTLIPVESLAIIGMPLTPFSVAGVARRTTRRAVYMGAAMGAPYYGYGVYPYAGAAVAGAAAAATIAALPGGCMNMYVNALTYYHCGAVYYRPVYDGPNVVYQSVPPP
jgi:hypothetical protein